MRFLFTCGGTAGHINPAIAVAGRLRELLPDSEFLFVGAMFNMEGDLVPREGFDIRLIRVNSLRRGFDFEAVFHNLKAAKNIVVSQHQAKKIIEEFRPDAVIGTGGYVCYPVICMAEKLGIPTLIHESNAVPGLTTRKLESRADVIMVGFDESRKYYKDPERVVVTGTPVRGDFLKWGQKAAKDALGIEGPLCVSFWGSLGARRMNELTADIIKMNCEKPAFRHIHATGNGEEGMRRMRELLNERGAPEKLPDTIDVRPYIFDMPKVMAAADVIVCRAGASTLGELCLMGKPAVLVPSPNVTNNHQEKNALLLSGCGGAVMLREGECTAEGLFAAINDILKSPERIAEMSRAMLSMAAPDAVDRIAETVLSLAQQRA